MAHSNKAETILKKIFFSSLDNSDDVYDGAESFYVISGHNGPRWIIPINPKQGRHILACWRPYRFISQVAWFALRQIYSLGMAFLMPGIKPLHFVSKTVLQLPGCDIALIPVVYVGTPGPQQKAVVTLVDACSGKALAVMKVALEAHARESLMRESEMLESLGYWGVKNTPKLLATDKANGRTWQTVVSGCLSPRKLTERHIGWLLSLHRSNKTTTFDKQKEILIDLINQANVYLSAEQLIRLNKAIQKIQGKIEIPLVLVHGDFAPWNIKQQPNGQLAVIDWEDAKLDGLPLWDICHFYFMQIHLFGESKQLEELFSGQLIEQYLLGLDIDIADKSNLVRIYLVGTVLQKTVNKSREYEEFLIKQITRLPV